MQYPRRGLTGLASRVSWFPSCLGAVVNHAVWIVGSVAAAAQASIGNAVAGSLFCYETECWD